MEVQVPKAHIQYVASLLTNSCVCTGPVDGSFPVCVVAESTGVAVSWLVWEEMEVREGVMRWSEEVEKWEESGAVGVPSDSYSQQR